MSQVSQAPNYNHSKPLKSITLSKYHRTIMLNLLSLKSLIAHSEVMVLGFVCLLC